MTALRRGIRLVLTTSLFLVFGGVFLGVGLYTRSLTIPLDDGVIVSGTVVEIDESTDSDGDRTYASVVEYVDPATGQAHRVRSLISTSSRPDLGGGREVSLRPGDPSSARVLDHQWFSWIFIIVGGSIMLLGLATATKRFRTSGRIRGQTSDVEDSSPWEQTLADTPRGPGFRADPDHGDRLRYWDGSEWTDDYAPVLFED